MIVEGLEPHVGMVPRSQISGQGFAQYVGATWSFRDEETANTPVGEQLFGVLLDR